MAPEELRDAVKQQPFEPFRVVMTDGGSFEIRHPDLLLVGQKSAVVGLVSDYTQEFYDRTVKVDLAHIVRLEPLGTRASRG
jgi:hypothetical protein